MRRGDGKKVKWFRVYFGGIIRNGVIYQQTWSFYGYLYKSHEIDSDHPEVCDKFEPCLPYLCHFLQLGHIPTECRI